MQWVWISSPHNPHSITKYIQALAPSNNWLVVKDLIADRAVIIGQGGSLGWTLYNCINGCCYAVYQADMRGTSLQLYIFTASERSGYGMVEEQIGTRRRCGSMSLYRYSGQVSTEYSYNTLPTSAPGWENRTQLPLNK